MNSTAAIAADVEADRHPDEFPTGARVVVIHQTAVQCGRTGTVTHSEGGRTLVRMDGARSAIAFPNAQLCATTRRQQPGAS